MSTLTTGQLTTALEMHGIDYRETNVGVEALSVWRARLPFAPKAGDHITAWNATHVDGWNWEPVPTTRQGLMDWLGY